MDLSHEESGHLFRTYWEVWTDELTWEEIRAHQFRPWAASQEPTSTPVLFLSQSAPSAPSQSALAESTPVPPETPVPSLDGSAVASVFVLPDVVSQPVDSGQPPSGASSYRVFVPFDAFYDFGSFTERILQDRGTFETNRASVYFKVRWRQFRNIHHPSDSVRGAAETLHLPDSLLPSDFESLDSS